MTISKPIYIEHRLSVFNQLYNKQKSLIENKEKEKITIKLKKEKKGKEGGGGKEEEWEEIEGMTFETTPKEIIEKYQLGENVIVAKVNGQMWDMSRVLEESCEIEYFNFNEEEGKKVFWHSSAHVIGQSLENVLCGDLCTGPATEDGFYYDMELIEGSKCTESELEKINEEALKIIKEGQKFERLLLSKEEAKEIFKYNEKKLEIIEKKVGDGDKCTVYRCGTLIDLCKGPHIENTNIIKSIEANKLSGCYWLGKQENDKLQRVYGISFPSIELMNEWKTKEELLKARDHRNIGKDQELFFTHPWSPGSVFFQPNGTRIYNKLVEFLRNEYWKRGFTEVISPNIYNIELWKQSGHWDNYRDNMFNLEIDNQQFALKPMNCPGHCLMFAQNTRSYKELPIRFADFGVLHRNELKGALSGLTRVRRFQQDDAHIFCSQHSVKDEIASCLDFMQFVYGLFNFQFDLELSTRPEKYMGELEQWDMAEKSLMDALNSFGRPWKLNPGDGAFYGPKIDIHIKDAIGRSHQCATIQLDFQLPKRFNLQFQTDESDKTQTPVIIHRAIFGSVERMLAILIEHTAGKWPFWLSPRQAIVLPVSNDLIDYAKSVHQQIYSEKFYIDIDVSENTLSKKIRDAQLAQYNFIIIIGKREQLSQSVTLRARDQSAQESMSVTDLIAHFKSLSSSFQ